MSKAPHPIDENFLTEALLKAFGDEFDANVINASESTDVGGKVLEMVKQEMLRQYEKKKLEEMAGLNAANIVNAIENNEAVDSTQDEKSNEKEFESQEESSTPAEQMAEVLSNLPEAHNTNIIQNNSKKKRPTLNNKGQQAINALNNFGTGGSDVLPKQDTNLDTPSTEEITPESAFDPETVDEPEDMYTNPSDEQGDLQSSPNNASINQSNIPARSKKSKSPFKQDSGVKNQITDRTKKADPASAEQEEGIPNQSKALSLENPTESEEDIEKSKSGMSNGYQQDPTNPFMTSRAWNPNMDSQIPTEAIGNSIQENSDNQSEEDTNRYEQQRGHLLGQNENLRAQAKKLKKELEEFEKKVKPLKKQEKKLKRRYRLLIAVRIIGWIFFFTVIAPMIGTAAGIAAKNTNKKLQNIAGEIAKLKKDEKAKLAELESINKEIKQNQQQMAQLRKQRQLS